MARAWRSGRTWWPSRPPGIHRELVARILGDSGRAPRAWRRAAFDNTDLEVDGLGAVVNNIATDPTRVTDDDFARLSETGLTDDQLWEIVICAAVGQASPQYESALSALAAATAEDQP